MYLTASLLVIITLSDLTLAAPHRTVTYNQTQHGHHNVQADLENILILVVPSRKFIGSALNIFDRRDVPSQKNIPEPPEIATEVSKEQNVETSVKPVANKEHNLPNPPEPAKPEITTPKVEMTTQKVAVTPKKVAAEIEGDKKQESSISSNNNKPAAISNSRGGRGSQIITAKLLGFGVSPASD